MTKPNKSTKRPRSEWMTHLLAFYSKNKGNMSFKDAMKEAKKTYKKGS